MIDDERLLRRALYDGNWPRMALLVTAIALGVAAVCLYAIARATPRVVYIQAECLKPVDVIPAGGL